MFFRHAVNDVSAVIFKSVMVYKSDKSLGDWQKELHIC